MTPWPCAFNNVRRQRTASLLEHQVASHFWRNMSGKIVLNTLHENILYIFSHCTYIVIFMLQMRSFVFDHLVRTCLIMNFG